MSCNQQPPERAKRKANAACHPASPRVQTVSFPTLLDPLGNTQQFSCVNPVSTLCCSVSDSKNTLCSFLVKRNTVECKATTNFIQYNGTDMDILKLQWANPNRFAIADGWAHAGAAGLKDNRRPLIQEFDDDVLVSGHERTIPYLKGVGKT